MIRQGKVTSTDIARILGVSQSTVSRAFNPKASISDKKRQMVLEGAKKLGYTPNAMARSLISRRSGLIAIVTDSETNPIYDEITRTLTCTIQEKGGQAVLCLADKQSMERAVSKAIEYQVDGLIIATSHLNGVLLDRCRDHGIQLTFINQYLNDVEASCFCSDNRQLGKEVADYLIAENYQQIAYLAGDKGSMVNEDRWDGFRDQLLEHGSNPPLYIPGSFSFQSGLDAADTLAKQTKAVDAVFCANDIIAIGLLEGLRGQPDTPQVAVIGVDDIAMAAWPSFQLTTYRQPFTQLITAAIDELLQRIENDTMADQAYHYFTGELICRTTA
jgi:DNA-binding LacI/PurR family transcriptional regulator